MRKFKIGDKVKVINSIGAYKFNVNKVGFVVFYDSLDSTLTYKIRFVDGSDDWVNSDDIELLKYDIKSILFNNPYTTVLFNDGTKSIVKCHVNDEFDEYQGFVNAVAKHTLQMSGLEIAELIESKAKRKQDNVIRVGDKVVYEEEEYYVTHIDDVWYHTFPYKLSKCKDDVGLDASQLNQKYGYQDATWSVSRLKDLIKVKSK